MTLPELEEAIQRQVERVFAAREAEAIEGDLMYDSIDFSGVTFYRPTLAHVWLVLTMERARAWRTAAERRELVGYTLTFPAEQVRNRLCRAFAVDREQFRRDAIAFFSSRREALAVVETLLADLRTSVSDDDDEPLRPGWWARCVDQIAAHYHWSEDAIFALPLVRFSAYSRAIAGSDRLPDTAMPAEEQELARLQQLRMEMTKHGRDQKPADQDPGGE